MKGSPTVFWIWFSLMTRTPSILRWMFSHLSVHQTIYLLLSTTVLPKIIFLKTTQTKKYIKRHFSQEHNNNMAEAIIFENWQRFFDPSLNFNETWDRWNKQFFKEVKSFIGHEIRNDKTTSKSAKWFNKDICRLIKAKSRSYRRATTSGKSYHWEASCAARTKATYAIRVAKVKFYNQKAETLANPNCPPSNWWQLTKELCDLNGRNSTTIPPLRTCAQHTVKNDQEKANLLNHTFINQNTCLNLEGFPIGPMQLKSVFTIQDICPAEVKKNHQVFTKQSFFWF